MVWIQERMKDEEEKRRKQEKITHPCYVGSEGHERKFCTRSPSETKKVKRILNI